MKYKDAGVDVQRGYAAVEKIKEIVKSTFNENVLTGIGDFGASYAIPGDENNILVSGADGVGTKLKLAFQTDRHKTIGQDCVAMCVNDILASGAKPLFFLDYLATGKIDPEKIADIVSGIAEGCRQAGVALIGGETAEMPGFYKKGEYDLAGFSVGIVNKEHLIDKSTVQPGDSLIGLASSGPHSNGYSLIRKLFQEDEYARKIGNRKIIDILLQPTKIYVPTVLKVMERISIRSMAHITGGGFIENIPRALPEDLGAEIYTSSWQVPEIFREIRKRAELDLGEMFNTFNMGIGFVLIVSKNDVEETLTTLSEFNEKAVLIGRVKTKKEARVWFA